ncbi:MAG TPA: helix-turn-helix transcriptional regulator [Rhizomicrobium sp.]|nr:helix-turn-helix transcriptional regulator [Rhizomicrobium sp.]
MEKVQIIHDNKGRPAFAVVPWNEFERLKAGASEDEHLIATANAARGEESYPADIARRLVAGEPPVKVFREWRGMTQQQLSTKSGVAIQYISQLERRAGGRNVGRKVAAKLAPALKVSVEAILEFSA